MSELPNLQLITGNRTCSADSLVPWLLLETFDLPYQETRIDLFRGNAVEKTALFSPSLKVPVLVHGDIKVWDPLPICEYLSETFLENRAWPANQKKKATARSICGELHGDFTRFKQEWPMNCHLYQARRPSAALEREIARLDAIMSCCHSKFGDGGDFLFGHFSIADAFIAPFAIALDCYGAELTAAAKRYVHTLLEQPHLQWWLEGAQRELDEIRFARKMA
ncbi:MAG: glutathione S-transferase [Pseudomonadales bacterium]|jgi:glutathione S-transferase|nr:glutathione S-transferase [Pseudomonadales bacterium]